MGNSDYCFNSDDLYYHQDVISKAIAALQAKPELGMVYGDGVMVDGDLRLLDWHQYPQYQLTDLLAFNVLLQPAVVMRHQALKDAGYLSLNYHLILDHALWIKIAAKYPILHIADYWAVERTHADAKTIAMASLFVEEAFRWTEELEKDQAFSQVIEQHHEEIYAGLHIFAGKRLIDAGSPKEALMHFKQARRFSLGSTRKVWYKVVQAMGGSIGLTSLFLKYRSVRRGVTHHTRQLSVGMDGVKWLKE